MYTSEMTGGGTSSALPTPRGCPREVRSSAPWTRKRKKKTRVIQKTDLNRFILFFRSAIWCRSAGSGRRGSDPLSERSTSSYSGRTSDTIRTTQIRRTTETDEEDTYQNHDAQYSVTLHTHTRFCREQSSIRSRFAEYEACWVPTIGNRFQFLSMQNQYIKQYCIFCFGCDRD